MPQKIIINSLRESLSSIWKNKSWFVLLFLMQILFLVILFLVSYHYQNRIVQSANEILNYISQQKLDEASATDAILQQKNILGDDPLMISRNFNEIVKNFRIYLIYIFVLLIVFISMAWSITHKMLHKNNFKQLIKNFLKNLVVLLFYLGLIFGFFFSLLNISLTQLAQQNSMLFIKYSVFLLVSIILAYFMFISLALIIKTEFKNIVQKTLVIGIKKVHYILSVYFINIFLFALSIFLLLYFIEKNLFVSLLSLLLMIFSFVFGRILMVGVVEKLN